MELGPEEEACFPLAHVYRMRLKFWGKSRGFRGAMDEILSFGGPGKLNLAAALKGAKDRKKEEVKPKSAKWSSSTHSDSDEDGESL